MQLKVYTIGHGNKTLDQLVDLLKAYSIQALVDIRSYPRSKRNPHFNHDILQARLPSSGLGYVWLKGLGGYRKTGLGATSPHGALRSKGFRNYADYMLTEAFRKEIERLCRWTQRAKTCLMCAETLPFRCHRWLLSDYLIAKGFEVVHMIAVQQASPHELSRYARIEDGQVFYDRKAPEQQPLAF